MLITRKRLHYEGITATSPQPWFSSETHVTSLRLPWSQFPIRSQQNSGSPAFSNAHRKLIYEFDVLASITATPSHQRHREALLSTSSTYWSRPADNTHHKTACWHNGPNKRKQKFLWISLRRAKLRGNIFPPAVAAPVKVTHLKLPSKTHFSVVLRNVLTV